MFEPRKFLVGQDGRLQLDQIATRRLWLEQIALGTEGRFRRRDQFLADAVNGRIGHLREELLEIIVEQLRFVGQNRRGSVATHRADRLDPVAGHRRHDDAQILERVTKSLLPLQHGKTGFFGFLRHLRRHRIQLQHVPLQPVAIGLFGGDLELQFLVRHNPAFLGVN